MIDGVSLSVSCGDVRGGFAKIGAFELDVAAAELRRSGRLVALAGQPMRVLIRLVEQAGAIVTRDELQREIWGDDTHVDFEAGLSTCINQIRSALGDRAAAPRFIETLRRRGYRFVAPVAWSAAPSDEAETSSSVADAAPVAASTPVDRLTLMPRPIRARLVGVAVAMAAAAAVALWFVGTPFARPPVPIAVMAVDVDPARSDLQPVSRSLTDALVGALASEAGDRARVLSPLAAQKLGTMTLDAIQESGIDYVVLVTLHPLGGPVLVHVKLVGPGGWVRWTADRAMSVDELERAPLRLADELSKPLMRRIAGQHAG